MCGIIGFCGQPREGQWGETYAFIEAMFLNSEHRGRDATGFAARMEPFKGHSPGRVVVARRALRASRFVRRSPTWQNLRRRRCTTIIGHLRWATHGSPKHNENNHPFTGRRGLYLVHNGVLLDHAGVCEMRGLELRSDCDSEAIVRVVEAARTPPLGLAEALRDLSGSMAVALYDARSDVTYLARNEGRPLWLMRLTHDRRFFFASTAEILLEALTDVHGKRAKDGIEILMPMAADHVHALTTRGKFHALPSIEEDLVITY